MSRWLPAIPSSSAARPYRSWLRERSSLTARWQRASGDFRVFPVRQALSLPLPDERGLLRLASRRLAWVREVVLQCGDTPVAFAHTALAAAPRGRLQRWLRRLGRRSLGTLLFVHPGFVRLASEYCRLDRRHPLHAELVRCTGSREPRYWARRTLFAFGDQRVLVTEVFLPAALGFGQ